MSATTPELLPDVHLPPLRSADGLPRLVLLPVPVSEPPYDDELAERSGPRLTLVTAPPAPVGPLAHLTPLHPAPPVALAAPPPSTAPAVRPVARALVQGLLEVLGGVRPVTQLRRRTSPELYADLEALVQAQPRPVGARPSSGAVLSLHALVRGSAAGLVCATGRRGRRGGALALRLELDGGGAWCCTTVAGLGPDLPTTRPEAVDDEG